MWCLTLGAEVAARTLTQSFGLAFYSEDGNLPGLEGRARHPSAAGGDKIVDQSFMFGVQAARMLVRALENAVADWHPLSRSTPHSGR